MSLKKITTDNIPLLDELIHALKVIISECVIKDESEIKETVDTKREGSLYINCIKGLVHFDSFTYSYSDLINLLYGKYVNDYTLLKKWSDNNGLIPDTYRDMLTKYKRDYIINNYVEGCYYYRTYNGLPDLNKIKSKGLYVDDEFKNKYNFINYYNSNGKQLMIHELSPEEQDTLYSTGLIDSLYNEYGYEYLKYLGSRKISIYNARTANNFALLYVPDSVPPEVLNRFKDAYEKCRLYTLTVIYNEAFKYDSEYYDAFMKILILLQTFLDVVTTMPDMIIKREIFDLKTIKLLFESSGVDYFKGIPYKYQLAMMRNLNTLIKFKSTTKNIVDICSLFGFDNIEIFKYYLLKTRRTDENGEYIDSDDANVAYDLKFLKVPIDDIPDNHIRNSENYEPYDSVTLSDKYWDGDKDHYRVRDQIINMEFNYIRSKYLSVDILNEVNDMNRSMIYFYNMIFNAEVSVEEISLSVPYLDFCTNVKLTDLFIYLFAISFLYEGFEDTIPNSTSKILYMLGFDFDTDMDTIITSLANLDYTYEDLGLPKFDNRTYFINVNDLMNAFNKNYNMYKLVCEGMKNAQTKKEFDAFELIYKAYFTMECNRDFYKNCSTLTEYLQNRNINLYNSLINLKSITDEEALKDTISSHIQYIVYSLETLLKNLQENTENSLFKYIPTVSTEAVQEYIMRVIDFYKSYRIQIYNMTTSYKFNDKLDNMIRILERHYLTSDYNKKEYVRVLDNTSLLDISLNPSDNIHVDDYIHILVNHIYRKYFNSVNKPIDKHYIECDTRYKDIVNIRERVTII